MFLNFSIQGQFHRWITPYLVLFAQRFVQRTINLANGHLRRLGGWVVSGEVGGAVGTPSTVAGAGEEYALGVGAGVKALHYPYP
jgi:hypothetical protein